MKILIAVDTMAIGGAEGLAALLANNFVDRGHDCAIVAFHEDLSSATLLDNNKIRVVSILRKFALDPFYLIKTRRFVRKYKPDILLCQNMFSYFSITVALLGYRKIPLFLVLHYTYNVRVIDKIFDRINFNLLSAASLAIIATYQKQIALFSKRYHIPPDSFTLVHNGINVHYFNNTSKKEKNNSLHIIHIASMREEKDQMTLLHGLKIFDNSFKEWHLIFCGKNPYELKSKLMNYIISENLQQKITIIDYIDDIRILLKEADVFILSSISEALPISALEAQSMGIPCILTDVGGCDDIIDDGINGFLIPPRSPQAIADKLLFLAHNPQIMGKMRREARNKIMSEFSIERMTEKYLQLFKEKINQASQSPNKKELH